VSLLDDPAPADAIPFRAEPWFPAGIDGVAPLARDPGCRRCALARSSKNVCMAGGGPGGAPLVVGSTPTHHDDIAGRLVPQGTNQILAADLARVAPDARIVWAVSCAAGRDPEPDQVAACRPFLAWEFDLRPPRAVLLGPLAVAAVTGQPFNPGRLRRGRCWARGVPCFLVVHPQAAAANRHVRDIFRQDLEWALRAPLEPAPDGVVEFLRDPARAEAWLRAVRRGQLLSFDFEHHPRNPWAAGFAVIAGSFAQDPTRPVTIPGDVLAAPGVRAALKAVLEDVHVPKVGQDVKHDRHVAWRAYGVDVAGVAWDTMVASRLRDPDALAGLKHTSWQAGFGGFKDVGQRGADDEDE
jgi:uracil-DNA glycosylase family 4